MAIAVVASGTQTAVIGTEHELATSTTGKTYVLVVDCVNLVNWVAASSQLPDVVELRLYTKVLSGGAEGLAYIATYVGVQSTKIKYSVPVPANISIKATLKQVSRVGVDFPWALLSID